MDTITTSPQLQSNIKKKFTHVRASELLTAFNYYADNIKILSLDCFDTLLWRKTLTPKDVFYELQQSPQFKQTGIRAIHRADSEANARSFKHIRHQHAEVDLVDIYRTGFPSLTDEEIAALIEEEIQAEMAACYAFPPVVAVIRAAAARGIKIIIVSNTYLREPQLRRLLASALPADVMPAIEKIFCSCEFNQSKNTTLFDRVIAEMGISAQSILHIGDDAAADFNAATLRDMHALRLVQFDKKLQEYFRLQSTAATITDSNIHYTRAMFSPFRGILSLATHATTQPESIIGYLSLGPIMYTFADYLRKEIDDLKRAGKNPKVLFLMRDAYLPMLACETLTGAPFGTPVRISRFCALAASFRCVKDIESFLLGSAKENFLHLTCRQLLLPETITAELIKQSSNNAALFSQLVLQENLVNYIIAQSKLFWERLKEYLLKTINIAAGDTLVFVDLGYTGRTQSSLTPILKEELKVEVTGRYLIALNIMEWQQSRKGLLDPSWCDDRTLNMICVGNTLLEELCCSPDNSVDNYQNGNPVFALSSAKTGQRGKTQLIQQECLRFIRDAQHYFAATNSEFSLTMLRDTATAELARRAFLPLSEEIYYLQDYQHDENRGTNLYFNAFENPEKELDLLRQQGLTFKKNINPYGLRSAGFELTLASMAQLRHGFEVGLDDLTLRRENIVVLLTSEGKTEKHLIPAAATHDGYFSLWLVVENQNVDIAILFGLHYQSVQITHAELIDANYFYKIDEVLYTQDIREKLFFNDMNRKGDNYFECLSTSSAVIAQFAQERSGKNKAVFRIVFRPVIRTGERK